MADNTTLNLGSGGDIIASDDLTTLNGGAVSGFKVQRVKVGFGSDAVLRDVDAANGLPVVGPLTDTQLRATPVPVSAASLPLPTGAATEATVAGVRTDLGTDGTTPPAVLGAGTGVRGWLRSIYEKLTGTLAVTGTFFQATQPVSIAATVTVDTELPAAAALADATANPTVPMIGVGLMAFNGTTWDRVRTDGTDNDADPNAPTGILSVEGHNQGYNGASWDRIRVGQSAATATPTGYQNVLAGGFYNATDPALTTGQTIPLQLDVKGNLKTTGINKQTYRASTIIPLVAAVTVNVPFFNIIGSATKTITIKRIVVSGMTLTAVGYFTINVEKLSTASTGGTSTTLIATALDSNNAAVTAVVKAYTVAPTKGTLVGTLRSFRSLWQATVAAAAGLTERNDFSFGEGDTSGVVLRGVAQELALTFPVVLASAGTLSVNIEWTEE